MLTISEEYIETRKAEIQAELDKTIEEWKDTKKGTWAWDLQQSEVALFRARLDELQRIVDEAWGGLSFWRKK